MPNETEEVQTQEIQPQEVQEEPANTQTQELAPFLSPEAIIMFSIAAIFDFIGWVLFVLDFFGIGEIPSLVLDIVGFLFFGFWMLIRTFMKFTTGGEFTMEGMKRAAKKTSKSFGKIAKRLGLATVAELIPFVGDISASWILLVYFEIKGDVQK